MLLSFLAALCLHALIATFAVYWPVNSRYKPNLNLPVLNLSQMTIGGKAPVLKPDPAPPESRAETAVPPPVAPVTPEADPALVPKIESLGQTGQQDKLRTETPVGPEKPAEQPKPEPAVTPKPEVKPKPEAKPRPAVRPNSEEILRRELEQTRLLAAIESARAESAVEDENRRNASARGNSYSGFLGDGVGVLAGYRESVISRIKPHFITRPRADGKVFELRVILDIAENGTVTRVTVVTPSEDSTFDQNVLRAINDAGAMEPPPSADDQRVPLIFTSDMYIG
jgi:TonB family protein